MKKIMLLFVALNTLTAFNSLQAQEFDLIGKWAGEDEKEIGFFIFQEDGYAFFEIQGVKKGGKDYVENGEKASLTYSIDLSKKPIELDIILKKHENGEINSLLTIIEVINADQFKMRPGFGGERPTSFEDKEDIMIFNRVK